MQPINHDNFHLHDFRVERETFIRTYMPESALEQWRCLNCLTYGEGEEETVNLALPVHQAECSGDPLIGLARWDLLQTISLVSEDRYLAGWRADIEEDLLKDASIWKILADQIGWPLGYMATEGWASDYTQAVLYFQQRAESDQA